MASRCMWTVFMPSLGNMAFLVVNYLCCDIGQYFLGRGE